MMQKYKVLFAGSGEFAIPVLEELLNSSIYEVVGVITQPHKPVGREQRLAAASLEQWLAEANRVEEVRLFRPEKLRVEAETILSQTSPDLVVVAAYGQMVPDIMLNYTSYGAVNFHGSLLPRLRGAVPVPMAILTGLAETGVTLQKMVKQLDAGAIIAQQICKIDATETTGSLMSKLAAIAAQMVETELVAYLEGRTKLTEQNEAEATFCYEQDIGKSKAEITLETRAELADKMVRAFNPWPVAWAQIKIQNNVKRLKVLDARLIDEDKSTSLITAKPGQIMREGKSLFLQMLDGRLELITIQLEGKKQASAAESLYLAGAELQP